MDLPEYEDHIGLWADDLKAWAPDRIFDAHVHLSPPEIMAPFSPERLKEPLCTFSSLTWEQLDAVYGQIYRGKQIEGLVAFPLPLREVDVDLANRYIIDLMKRVPKVRGFLLSHPTEADASRRVFDQGLREGVRFAGVKPYFDLLGKSNYETTMPEFIPEGLLEFMNEQDLVMMLHTSDKGVGDAKSRDYLRSVLERHP